MSLRGEYGFPDDSTTKSAAERAQLYADKVPPAISGQGGHDQTFALAMALVHGFALSENEALLILQKWNAGCEPPWSDKDLIHKIRSAAVTPPRKPRGYLLSDSFRPGRTLFINTGPQKKPAVIDPATAVENYLNGFRVSLSELQEASPVRPADNWTHDAGLLISTLFAPGEYVNITTAFTINPDGTTCPHGYGTTLPREQWLARIEREGPPKSQAGTRFRINPLDGEGITDGNVTAFRYALIECDNTPLDLQLSLLARLTLPITTLLTSGGRSIHALVEIDASDEAQYRAVTLAMLRLLAKFGVDTKNQNPSRMSRLPGVQRTIGAEGDGRQRLIYLNPHPEQRRIIET